MPINENFRYLHVGLPDDILQRKLGGDPEGAVRLIDRRLKLDTTPEALRCCLTAQREIILRRAEDYPYTKAEALAVVREHIPDFSEEEFEERVDAGKIGWIYLHGERRFFNRFFQSMCKSEPAFGARAGVRLPGVESAGKGSAGEGRLDRCARLMKERGSLSNRIRIRASLRMKDEVFEPGMFVRAHLPIPAACEQQSEIIIEKVFPAGGKVSPEDAPQRTICWETHMEENQEFYVEYSYVHTARYHDAEKMLREGTSSTCTQPDFFTNEEPPHILFTPYLRELVAELAGDTINPLEKARRFYDFITQHMKYSFMPAYFGLEQIAESCARNFTGDCGVFALLFLTLCRCAGIPACWQSGLTVEPDFCGAHDWVRFYVEPYGWLYADPSYGTAAVRAENEERRRFYFGNLDVYRMVANNAFQVPFTIDKEHWRSDPYDNQLGEMETSDRGLRYGEFERNKVVLMCEEIA
ncbi:transglutaminase domain-containing protein [bacterium 1XD21-13]|nr:transglutaminase domain-containing protein [bacterium 1XD21-13]